MNNGKYIFFLFVMTLAAAGRDALAMKHGPSTAAMVSPHHGKGDEEKGGDASEDTCAAAHRRACRILEFEEINYEQAVRDYLTEEQFSETNVSIIIAALYYMRTWHDFSAKLDEERLKPLSEEQIAAITVAEAHACVFYLGGLTTGANVDHTVLMCQPDKAITKAFELNIAFLLANLIQGLKIQRDKKTKQQQSSALRRQASRNLACCCCDVLGCFAHKCTQCCRRGKGTLHDE